MDPAPDAHVAPEAPSEPPSGERPRGSGFTLVEAVVVTAILLLGLLALSTTTLATRTLRAADRERQLAVQGLKSVCEEVRVRSNAVRDDPDGWSSAFTRLFVPGANPGDVFEVRGLDAWDGTATVGSLEVVTDETLTDAELGVELGMPRDLDGDGEISNADVRATARMLPVVVRVRWSGTGGEREEVQGFYVLGY